MLTLLALTFPESLTGDKKVDQEAPVAGASRVDELDAWSDKPGQ